MQIDSLNLILPNLIYSSFDSTDSKKWKELYLTHALSGSPILQQPNKSYKDTVVFYRLSRFLPLISAAPYPYDDTNLYSYCDSFYYLMQSCIMKETELPILLPKPEYGIGGKMIVLSWRPHCYWGVNPPLMAQGLKFMLETRPAKDNGDFNPEETAFNLICLVQLKRFVSTLQCLYIDAADSEGSPDVNQVLISKARSDMTNLITILDLIIEADKILVPEAQLLESRIYAGIEADRSVTQYFALVAKLAAKRRNLEEHCLGKMIAIIVNPIDALVKKNIPLSHDVITELKRFPNILTELIDDFAIPFDFSVDYFSILHQIRDSGSLPTNYGKDTSSHKRKKSSYFDN